jgi:glycerophosphoryl diester phosphodiesterase
MHSHPFLLGHRGARAEKSIPENSLESFDLALAQGCDGFEFDVRLSADGEALLCHDPEFRGLTIAQHPARQLQLPSLRDVLVRYRNTAFLDIELKVASLEKITADLLRSLAPQRDFVVSSFLPGVLESLHAADAGIPLGLICETPRQLDLWPQLPVEYLILHRKLIKKAFIAEAKSAGKKLFVWTVNLPAEMRRFSRLGVDGIISDDPGLLVRTLRRKINSKTGQPLQHP